MAGNKRVIKISEVVTGGIRNISGKARGESARKHFGLDRFDEDDEEVTVVFPDSLYAISSSFFLGLFSLSIKRLGETRFLRKYHFVADENIQRQIRHGIQRATMSRDSLVSE